MDTLNKISNKVIFEKYCKIYSKWFGKDKLDSNEINTKELIKLIKKEYINMSQEEKAIERISLQERIFIGKNSLHKVEYNFYKICFDVLNENEFFKSSKNEIIDDGFLVELFNWIFGALEQLSIFNLIRKLKNDKSYNFVDLWIIGNLLVAIFSTILIYNMSNNNKIIIYIILLYSILRIFEVIIYQINVLLFHPYRSQKRGEVYKIKSITRMVIALLSNYVEIMFWYSSITISIIILNGGNHHNLTWLEIIRSNIVCIATLDGNTVEKTLNSSYRYLSSLVFLEMISGVIMTIISLSRFIGALPQIVSKGQS